MKILYAISCLLVFLSISCTKDTSPLSNIPEGAFEYQSFDTSGTQIISGWIYINFADSNNLKGNWNLSKIGDPPNLGPQVGKGEIGGSIENNNVYIKLNPGWADDNVNLLGVLENNIIEGTWYYSIFVGAINGGKFKAIKK